MHTPALVFTNRPVIAGPMVALGIASAAEFRSWVGARIFDRPGGFDDNTTPCVDQEAKPKNIHVKNASQCVNIQLTSHTRR
jgi:hypothetical protein